MNLRPLLVVLAMCLTAGCAHSVKDDSPASDLDALETTVARDLQTRRLPNGKEYCAELARTEDQQDACMGDLEDGFFQSNRDKERALRTLRNGLERIRQARNPCGLFDWDCRRRRRALDQP